MITDKLYIVGVLEPIANHDWHGKWRIQKAIEQAQELMRENEEMRRILIRYQKEFPDWSKWLGVDDILQPNKQSSDNE